MALLAALALPSSAQEKPMMFPPVAQILGAEPAMGGVPAFRPQDFDKLVGRLSGRDLSARKEAAQILGAENNLRAVPYLGAVLLQLNEPDDLRVAAAMALGRVRNWRSAAYLRQTLTDPVREVRFASVLALGKTKTKDSLPLLAHALAVDSDWWVRFAAAVALGDNRDPISVKALASAAKGEKEWQVRLQAVRSLGQQGSRDAALALGEPLQDSDPAVRAASAMALGDIGGLESINLLAGALRDESQDFPRRTMADSLKKLLAKP